MSIWTIFIGRELERNRFRTSLQLDNTKLEVILFKKLECHLKYADEFMS